MRASPQPDHRATITQRLVIQIGERIVAGAYPPGAPLRESELAARYGVSRHVVREVLRTLAADGLVDYASFRGARTPTLTEADARDIYRSRRMLECSPDAMCALPDPEALGALHRDFAAAVKAGDFKRAFDLDVAFHTAIAAANSPRAAAWLASLMQALRLAHLVAPSFNTQAFRASIAQHRAILDAIKAGNAKRARKMMREHLDAAERALLEDMAASA